LLSAIDGLCNIFDGAMAIAEADEAMSAVPAGGYELEELLPASFGHHRYRFQEETGRQPLYLPPPPPPPPEVEEDDQQEGLQEHEQQHSTPRPSRCVSAPVNDRRHQEHHIVMRGSDLISSSQPPPQFALTTTGRLPHEEAVFGSNSQPPFPHCFAGGGDGLLPGVARQQHLLYQQPTPPMVAQHRWTAAEAGGEGGGGR
jgi:hypothetical protein